MDAMVVAPAPAQAPAQHANKVQPEQGGNDSTFAPTLSQALSKKKTSEQNQSPAERQQTRASGKSSQDPRTDSSEESGLVDEQAAIAAATPADEQHPQIKDTGTVQPAAGQKGGIALARSQSALFSQILTLGNRQTDGASDGVALDPKNAAADKAMFSVASLHARTAGESPVKERVAAFSAPPMMTGTVKTQTAQSSALGLQGGPKSLEMMQPNDTVAWSRIRPDSPQAYMQQPLSVAFNEDGVLTANPQTTVSTEKLLAGLSQIAADGNGPAPLRNTDQASLRQTIGGQFFESKIETADTAGEQKNQQQFFDGDSNPARQLLTAASAKPADSSVESSFSQNLNQAGGDKVSQTAAEPMRPGALPFTTVVSENEILQQVTNKFRISQHLQDSKITMRLHPAELGSLKIDIQLKGGMLNANIVAQTQQVHEILEKNMPRLRALMEQQGLEVGEIVIRVEADEPSEHNLFDEQLSEHAFSSGQDGKRSRTVFTMDPDSEEEELAEHRQDPGVNVKI